MFDSLFCCSFCGLFRSYVKWAAGVEISPITFRAPCAGFFHPDLFFSIPSGCLLSGLNYKKSGWKKRDLDEKKTDLGRKT